MATAGRAIAVGLIVSLAIVASFLHMRPDIGAALPIVLAKAGFSALATAVAIPLLLQLARPGRPPGWRLIGLGGFFALAALIAIVALMAVEEGQRMTAWTNGGFPWCVVLIPILATPAAGLLIWRLMRDLAPTRLGLSGASLGAAAGGIGAMAYSTYCPTDSAAFVATWYALAIAVCAVLGAIAGTRLMRW
jgi:hypothetical protein